MTIDEVVYSVGDISVTPTELVFTNGFRYPLVDTEWTVTEHTQVVRRTTVLVAILACITAFFTCGLGFLFLLIKEDKVVGFVQVSVTGPGLHHSTQLPVAYWNQNPNRAVSHVAETQKRVAAIRQMTAHLRKQQT